MAYVEVYNATWDDYGGTEHEIKLLQEGGSNVGSIDILQTTPYTRSVSGGKKAQIENQIFGAEIRFNFVVASADVAAFDAILESDYKEWKIEHYYDSSLDFVGWLQPDNFSREYVKNGDYYFFSYSAVDGLANLKNIEFINFSDGSQYDDRITIMTTLKRALEHIGFELDFRVQLGTWCTNDSLMTSTECALDKVTHDSRRFQKTKDGRLTNTNIYKVISELLEPFNCYLIQSQAQYWIINTREDNSFYFPIPWSTLTVGSRTASDLKIDISGAENFTNRGNFQKIRPLETVGATFRDRNVRDNALSNGDFHLADTSEWVESSEWSTFDTPAFELNFELQAVIDQVEDPISASAVPNFHSVAQTIAVRGENDQIQVQFKVRMHTLTMDPGYSAPTYYEGVNVKCQIRKGTASGDIISAGAPLITIGAADSSYRNYLYYFNISEDDDYFVEFLVEHIITDIGVDWDDYVYVDIRFDDINVIAAYSTQEDVTFDKYFKVSNADSSFTDFLDVETQFGDSTSGTDIGAFKIGGDLTETWSRFGKSENTSINFLVAKNIIENFSKYKDYIRLTIIDDTDRILPHSLIELGSSVYQIVSQSATFKGGLRKELKVELMEVLNAAVNVTIQEVGLSSVDGDGGSSSPFDDAVTNPSTNPSQPGLVPSLQQVTDVGNTSTNNIGVTSASNSYFTGGGNVGIGTTSPNSKLDIRAGRLGFSGINIAHGMTIYAPTNSGGVLGYLSSTEGGLLLRGLTDGNSFQAVSLEGYISAGSITIPAVNIIGGKANGTAIQALAATEKVMDISNTTTKLVTVLGSGNVGIGTTTPGTELEVNGIINAVTNLQEGGVDLADIYEGDLGNPGTDFYVLASTIAGARSWVSNSAGGITEGTWTPVVSGVTVTNARGYSQITGNMVTLIFSFTMPVTASASTFFINNAPITSAVAGVGKPIAYHGLITKIIGGGLTIDNRLELGANSVTMAAVADSAPTGRTLVYFSNSIVTGSITYVKD